MQSFKYFLLPISLLLIGSCSFPGSGGPQDFTSLYKAHIGSQLEVLRDTAKEIGYGVPLGYDGIMKINGMIPSVFSGSLTSNYSSDSNGREMSFDMKKLSFFYTSILSTGSLMIDDLSFVSKTGDAFFKITNLSSENLLPPETVTLLKKYEGKWISYTAETRMKLLSGSTEEERIQFQISEMLSKMTLDDVEQYLTKYPIFRQTADLGMSGSLHNYSVELDRTNIIALADDFTQKATGKSLSEDAKKNISDNLSGMNIIGMMSFDPKESRTADFVGNIQSSGSTETIASFQIHQKPNNFSFETKADTSILTFNIATVDQKTSLDASISASGAQMAKWNMVVQKDDNGIARLDSTLTAQGITVTLVHTNDKNGNFSGSLNFGIGNLGWNGKTNQSTLESFHLNGATIGMTLALDLEKSGNENMLTGPLIVKSGTTETMKAQVGLRATLERFSLKLDVADVSGSGNSLGSFDMDILGKKRSAGKVVTPSETTSIESIINEISSLYSADTSPFQEDTISGITESGITQ